MLDRVASVVRDGRRFLVTMHRRPDGDAVGASLALAQALREMGKDVVHFNPDPVPAIYGFLPGAEALVQRVGRTARFDATLACDAGRLDRLGPGMPGPARRGLLIDVDHHAGPPFGDLALVDPDAASTGVLVRRLLHRLGHPLSEAVATALYASILADTGSFRYDSTDPESLRIAAELLETGVRPWQVASRIYESVPEGKMRLVGEALTSLALEAEGRYAVLTVTRAMLERCGVGEDAVQGIVNYARSIAGVEVAALFLELPRRRVEVIVRSRGNCDLSPLAESLGARAGRNAAGAYLTGSCDTAKQRAARAVAAVLSGPGTAVA